MAQQVTNGDDLYNVMSPKKFNYIANSDSHQSRHLYSWKTLVRAEKNKEARKAAITASLFYYKNTILGYKAEDV